MTEREFLNLLSRRESESLDFKRDPYPIVGASEEEKGKLIKDILAFANAWRDGTAHILLGVDESSPEGPTVTGIPPTDPVDDAMLQQLLHSKLNRPLSFGYERITVNGRSVGVIEIPQTSDRPYFLRKAFGGVAADAVYIRRGSSNNIADPDEIARMGQAESRSRTPKLSVEFAGFNNGSRFGSQALMKVSRLNWPPLNTPERAAIDQRIREEQRSLPWATPKGKKLEAAFAEMHAQLSRCSVAFVVTNQGPVPARDLEVNLWMPRTETFSVVEIKPLPFLESRAEGTAPNSTMDTVQFPTSTQVTLKCPKLHAGQSRLIRCGLVLSATSPARYPLRAQISADELPSPMVCDLLLTVECDDQWFVYNP